MSRATISILHFAFFAKSVQKQSVVLSIRQIHAVNKIKDLPANDEESHFVKVPYKDAAVEKQVEIHTCGRLFEKWRRDRKFLLLPKTDLQYLVRYIDTGRQGLHSNDSPTILALHGSPGSFRDFETISSSLYNKGIRVIAPLFPGKETLKRATFRYTPEEKSEYVKDFLKAIRINRIDLLLCHSSALFPGQLLCLDDKSPTVNALCLLNPTTFENPKLMKPLAMYQLLVKMHDFPVTHQITNLVGIIISKTLKKLKGVSYKDQVLSVMNMVNSSIPQQATHFQKLLRMNLPILLAFSENDKLIDKKSSYKMAEMMVDEIDIHKYDATGKLCSAGGTNPFRKVLVFEKGSHFLFKKHPEIISDEISAFLFQNLDNHISRRCSKVEKHEMSIDNVKQTPAVEINWK